MTVKVDNYVMLMKDIKIAIKIEIKIKTFPEYLYEKDMSKKY